MPTQSQIDLAILICRNVINTWDPYDLIAGGVPNDEFGFEIAAIVGQLDRIKSRNDTVHVLSRVFSSAFEPELFDADSCSDVGIILFDKLLHAKIPKVQ